MFCWNITLLAPSSSVRFVSEFTWIGACSLWKVRRLLGLVRYPLDLCWMAVRSRALVDILGFLRWWTFGRRKVMFYIHQDFSEEDTLILDRTGLSRSPVQPGDARWSPRLSLTEWVHEMILTWCMSILPLKLKWRLGLDKPSQTSPAMTHSDSLHRVSICLEAQGQYNPLNNFKVPGLFESVASPYPTFRWHEFGRSSFWGYICSMPVCPSRFGSTGFASHKINWSWLSDPSCLWRF